MPECRANLGRSGLAFWHDYSGMNALFSCHVNGPLGLNWLEDSDIEMSDPEARILQEV